MKQKIPITFKGLNTKSDDKQAVPGSFVEVNNVIYDKLGRIDRRYAYKNLDVNKALDSIWASTEPDKMMDKISKYEDTLMALVKRSNFSNQLLVSPRGKFEADNLACDLSITSVDSKTKFNPNLDVYQNYNEQYQNIEYNETFKLTGLLSVEANRGEHTFKILRGEQELYSFSSPINVNGQNQYNLCSKLISVNTQSTVGPTTTYRAKFVYFILNALNETIDVYCIEAITNNNPPSEAISYAFSNLGLIHSFSLYANLNSADSMQDYHRAFFDVEKLNTNLFAIVFNEDVASLSTAKLVTASVTGSTFNILDNEDLSGSILSMMFPTLKKFKYSPSDTDINLAFASTINGFSYLTDNFSNIYAGVFKIDLSGNITIHKAITDIFSYSEEPISTPDGTRTFKQIVVNLAFTEDCVNGYNTYQAPKLYCTTMPGYFYSNTIQASANPKENKINIFNYDADANSITLQDTIYGVNLASRILTIGYNDFFITQTCDPYQASYYLMGYNRAENTPKVINQFFYQNASVVSNVNTEKLINFLSDNTAYDCSPLLSRNINLGWVANLQLISTIPTFSKATEKTEVNVLFGAGYRVNFSNKFQNNALKEYAVSTGKYNYYSMNTFQDYTDACSSKIITFNLNSLNRFNNIDFYTNKYFTGGYLASYDGKNITNNGFHQYPSFKTFIGNSPYRDIFGVLQYSLGSTNYKGSYVSRRGKLVYTASSANPSTDAISISYSAEQIKYAVGDKVRIYASGVGATLPGGINQDINKQFDFGVLGQVSDEYVVSAVDNVSNRIGLSDLTGTPVDITTAGSFSNLYVVKSPYGYFEAKSYSFRAIYTYLDAKGNIVRSAPSIPIIFRQFSESSTITTIFSTWRIVFEVDNYLFKNKNFGTNPVSVELYRTTGDSADGVYYLCGTALCDDSSQSTQVETKEITDAELVSGKQLYTTGEELEAIPVPNPSSLTFKDNRIYAVNGENKNEIWYSKVLINGEGVEFNDALTKRVNSADGDIVAIQSMDDKIVVFKEGSIHFFAGDGANAAGQGERFSDVVRISGSIGLDKNNPSYCLVDQGIVFKSNKGIYLLPRSLGEPAYIGAGIEDFVRNATNFGSIVENKKRNEFKLPIDNKIYVYNFEQQLWYSEDLSRGVLDLYSDNSGIYAIVDPVSFTDVVPTTYRLNQFLKQEEPNNGLTNFDDFTCGLDTSVYVPTGVVLNYYNEKLTSNWIELGGIQNFVRIPRMYILGDMFSGKFNIKITFEFDYGASSEVMTFTDADFTVVGNSWQVECHLAYQKCQAIKFTIESQNTSSDIGNSLKLSSILFEAGLRNKLPLPANRIK